jgi:hypothetical protein
MINSSRKFSPHELLFARKMNHFEDDKVNYLIEEVPMLLKRAAEIRLFHEETLPKAIDNLLHAQQQHRKNQDKQHNIQVEPLEVGSKVMLWDPKIKGKLDMRKSSPYIIFKRSSRNNYFITNCRTQVALKNAIPLRRLELIPSSVTEMDESSITNYDIAKIISVRGQEPNIEFLFEWKDKPKDKNTWVLERDLKKCLDQTNTESIILAFKANLKLRMGTRQTSGLSYLNTVIICLCFLPLILADNLPGNFTFCSFNKDSPILKYDSDCNTGIIKPIYETKNFTLLENRQFMISGDMFECWAEKITRTSRRILFLFPEEERLTPERIVVSAEVGK